jgi:hypothetical protein
MFHFIAKLALLKFWRFSYPRQLAALKTNKNYASVSMLSSYLATSFTSFLRYYTVYFSYWFSVYISTGVEMRKSFSCYICKEFVNRCKGKTTGRRPHRVRLNQLQSQLLDVWVFRI